MGSVLLLKALVGPSSPPPAPPHGHLSHHLQGTSKEMLQQGNMPPHTQAQPLPFIFSAHTGDKRDLKQH